MAKKKTLLYTIHLRDAALVEAINAQLTSPTGGTLVGDRLNYSFTGLNQYLIWRAPLGAADEYAINAGAFPPALPILNVGDPIPAGGAGYITSEWFNSSNTFPRNVATFTISSGWWIFGSSTKFYWGAEVVYAPAAAASTTVASEQIDPCPIPKRHVVHGFNIGDFANSQWVGMDAANLTNYGSTGLKSHRHGSRDVDGFGGVDTLDATNVSTRFEQLLPNGNIRGAWTRMYLEVPEAPSATTEIWRVREAAVTGQGTALAITAGLQLATFDYAGGTASLIGTIYTLTPGQRYKIDIHCDIDATADTITCDFYVGGKKLSTTQRAAGGLIGNRFISEINIGKSNAIATSSRHRILGYGIALNPKHRDRAIAQWSAVTAYVVGDHVHVGTDPATWKTYRCLQNNTNTAPGPTTPTFWRRLTDSIDWQQGSLYQWVRPKAFAATHSVNWTGDFRQLGKPIPNSTSLLNQLTSSSSGARCAVQLNLDAQVDSIPGAIGWCAAALSMVSTRGASGSGQLGYKKGTDAPVMVNVTQTLAFSGNTMMYNPVDLAALEPLGTTLELHHTKSASADACTISMMQGTVEVIGVFGNEDLNEWDSTVAYTAGTMVSFGGNAYVALSATTNQQPDLNPTIWGTSRVRDQVVGHHNCQIPLAPWTRQLNAMGPVVIVGGTYVGNGTGQDIAFKVPPCFVFIRDVTGASGHVIWWSAMNDAHQSYDQGTYLWGGLTVRQDLSFAPGAPTDDQQMRWLLSIAGPNSQQNQVGRTYHYIAFCDPGRRFALGGTTHTRQNEGPITKALDITPWLPEWTWIYQSANTSTTADGACVKSPAMGADVAKNLTAGATLANALTHADGLLTVRNGLQSAEFNELPFLCFRRADGNNDPGQAKVMFMGSYTGDGTASRTVSLAPASGLRPMWAIVVPENAAHITRDPSHTTNTSDTSSGATTATGITGGGIDSFSVGSTLNANGVVYHYFGFFGSATAGNGGWSTDTENVPVITETVPTDDFPDEPVEVPSTGGSTGPVITNEPDLEDDTEILDDTISVGGTVGGQTCEFYTRELMNIALQHIGISKTITSLTTEQTEAAAQARRFVRKDVNAVLRDYPWDFATAYQDLVLQTGSEDDPVNNDWTFAYYAPNAMMFARRISKMNIGRRYDPEPVTFREGLLSGRPVIFCNVEATSDEPLVLEYTVRQTCPAFYGDALFREALTWKFAASFAATLARDKEKQLDCLKVYNSLLPKAKVVDANEQQQEPPGDADWILGR